MGRRNRILGALAALVLGVVGVGWFPTAAYAVSPPSAPSITSLKGGPAAGEMTLKWSIPASNGGAAIASYEVRYAVDGGAFSSSTFSYVASVRSATIACPAPATPGHGCSFSVRANNGLNGAWSTTKTAVWAKPTAPALSTAVAGPGAGQARLTFKAPSSNGGLAVTGYEFAINIGFGFGGWNAIDPQSITTLQTTPRPVYLAVVPCLLTTIGGPAGCKYKVRAFNSVGASPASAILTAPLTAPAKAQNLIAHTDTVALGSGSANQTISWSAPASTGGLAISDTTLLRCSTANGSLCKDYSPASDWTVVNDYTGSPATVTTTSTCPENGRCAYEVKAYNAKGSSFVIGFAAPSPPTSLVATPSTTTAGNVNLTWSSPFDVGTSFGHYVVFQCSTSDNCSSGSWTTAPGDAAPWTATDLVGTATSTSVACGISTPCEFRIGYVGSGGHVGGVTNAVTAVGLDAPTLTATANGSSGSIDLSWTPPVTSATIVSYKIERDTGSGFAQLIVVGASPTTYTDNACGSGATCGYRVTALYTVGTSARSTPQSATAAP
jgi:titin